MAMIFGVPVWVPPYLFISDSGSAGSDFSGSDSAGFADFVSYSGCSWLFPPKE